MKTLRLARRLGLDGNPLRRRTDKIAVCLTALFLRWGLTSESVTGSHLDLADAKAASPELHVLGT
jgi:hypothetical protein